MLDPIDLWKIQLVGVMVSFFIISVHKRGESCMINHILNVVKREPTDES